MGGRTIPTECPHGKTIDWGDFGPDPDDGTVGAEPCPKCDGGTRPDRDALIAALSPDTVIAPEHMAEALYLARQEAIRLTGDRDRLASLLEKLKPYLEHPVQCGRYDIPSTGPCECGLDALLAEIGDEK